MKKVILILLGLITILLSNPIKAQTFICPITPLNPIGYPCSMPPGMIPAANFQFLGTGLITSPFDLLIKGGALIFPDDFVFQGDGHYNVLSDNLIIIDGTLRFTNNDIFAGRGTYIKNIKLLQIQEGAFNLLLVRDATYDSTGKLDIFQGAVNVDEWMNINNAVDLKWQSNGFSGVTGVPFFRIQTPDGIITVNQPGLIFEYKRDSIIFKSTTVATNFILEYNDFQLNVKSMLPDGSILIDFINNKIVTEKTRTNFRFNSEEVINLNTITESSILLDRNSVECDNCKVDIESAHHTLNLVALDDSSIEIPDEYTHNVEGYGELTINADDFTMNGMIGYSTGDGEVSNGEVRHHEEETTKQHTVEGQNFHGTIHGDEPALIDTQDSSMGVGHIEYGAGEHEEGDGDDHGMGNHGMGGKDTHIEFALGYTRAAVTDLLRSQPEIEQHEPVVGEEEAHDEALERPAAGEMEMHHEEEAHEIATRSLGAMNSFLFGSMSRTLLSAARAPESFELDQEGIRLNRAGNGEIHHNMAHGQSARILLNLGTQETVSSLLAERRFGFYPSLSASYPVGKIIPSVELKPLQGSLSFTVGYPLAGGTLGVRKEINGAYTWLYQREGLEIMGNRNFLGIGAKIGEIAGIPIITYFGYGAPGEGLGHSH